LRPARRKGDAAAEAAANLGISRATWFRYRQAGVLGSQLETPKLRKLRINSTHSMGDRGNDFYATPACAVHALMKIEKLPNAICDPCVGDGSILKVLASAGHVVSGMDIVDRGWPGTILADYLAAPGPFGAVVTNPPFRLAFEFLQKNNSRWRPLYRVSVADQFPRKPKAETVFRKASSNAHLDCKRQTSNDAQKRLGRAEGRKQRCLCLVRLGGWRPAAPGRLV
jgi:hypothetical protein